MTAETKRQQAYDQAWHQFHQDQHGAYAEQYERCTYAHRRILAEAEAGRPWSDLAENYRWMYDRAMDEIRRLDRQACEAGEVALATLEAIEQLDAWVDRRNQLNRETGAHLPSIGKADVA